MSRPPFLHLPDGVRATRLATRRGEFAVLDAEPAATGVEASSASPASPAGTARTTGAAGATGTAGTVLLVPGFSGSKEDFVAMLAPLAEGGYRAVAVDGRGQYETLGTSARHAYGLGALAEDVLAQAEALSPPAGATAGRPLPLHLVGHSLGGLIARGAVLRAAARGLAPFTSLTLVASGPGRVARWPRWRLRALSATMPFLGSDGIWRVLNPRPRADEVSAFLRHRWLSNAATQLLVTGRTLRHEPDRVARLAATGLPVHVVSGERDGVWPVRLLDRMAEVLDARRTVIRGAEHSPNAERPLGTAAALLDFWRSTAPPPPSGRRPSGNAETRPATSG
ncbi:alpha/beta fold hydrolase [Streptomyces sp. 4N509B]|uniref:alpha/beta fold hydrolase n=1 Tax=Streptomyces sp. 4N509B TaxID=3457413 RepID=UPI003FD46E82